MNLVPASHADLLEDETRAIAYLGTVMPDGSPQVTPIWFNVSGDEILINTARGRVKERNMRARPVVALLIADPHDSLRYVQIRASVLDWSEQGAIAHIGALSRKYRGRSWEPIRGQVRVVFRLRPRSVSVS